LTFLARSDTPPFLVEDRTNATEELRLQYRYLDLRRPAMQKNLRLRDEIAFRIRQTLHQRRLPRDRDADADAVDPRGARDFLVPSRVHPDSGTRFRSPRSSSSRSS
jgi:aspartyl-tRNA synthetase